MGNYLCNLVCRVRERNIHYLVATRAKLLTLKLELLCPMGHRLHRRTPSLGTMPVFQLGISTAIHTRHISNNRRPITKVLRCQYLHRTALVKSLKPTEYAKAQHSRILHSRRYRARFRNGAPRLTCLQSHHLQSCQACSGLNILFL